MAEAERLLVERGCPKVNLQVRESNDDALAFYAARGTRHAARGDGRDAAVALGKRLIDD